MEKVVPPDVLNVLNALQESGYEAYFVGGCVRDFLMGRKVVDWDIATNATPEQIQKIFSNSFYDNTFGTVGIPLANHDEMADWEKNYVEATTYRTESGYTDSRHPGKVEWGKTIEEDLSRRDFTMNALALSLDLRSKIEDQRSNLIDPYNGQDDIKNKLIKTVGVPHERFSEDALRLLRAIRLATQLNFKIDDNTWEAIVKNANLITNISWERIRDELLKILANEHAYDGIILLDQAGILDIIFPELARGKGISQARPGRHHTSDVFTHNIESLHHTPASDPIVRLATLLHDVGKPYVQGEDEDGHVIFYNHEVAGAKIAAEIADRLRLSKKQKEKIITLIRWHMFTVDEHITDSAIRRFIRRVGLENVADMMDLRIGDRLGGGTQVAESWRLKKFKERVASELNPPFSINDMAIDGNDIMSELKIKPGPEIGQILNQLFTEVDENLELNNKDYLLKRLHEVGGK